MLICIIGRTGSGKDYLAKKFEEKGLKQIKSYTTRPKRNENEDTHIFITKEEADKITDKIAVTEINGYEYFATYSQVKENDIYVIDPNGLKVLCENLKNEKLLVIYVKADDNERKEKAISRVDNKENELEIFNKRNVSEDKQFTEFENILNKYNLFILDNISTGTGFNFDDVITGIHGNIYLLELRSDYLYWGQYYSYGDIIDKLYIYRNIYSDVICDKVIDLIMKEL